MFVLKILFNTLICKSGYAIYLNNGFRKEYFGFEQCNNVTDVTSEMKDLIRPVRKPKHDQRLIIFNLLHDLFQGNAILSLTYHAIWNYSRIYSCNSYNNHENQL